MNSYCGISNVTDLHLICQMLANNFLGWNLKGPFLKKNWGLRSRTALFTHFHSLKQFHVAIAQRRLGNTQKSVMHVQSCRFAKNKPIAFLPFSLPSPSSLLKLPIVVIKRFFYHGNVTSYFSPLYNCRALAFYKLKSNVISSVVGRKLMSWQHCLT